LFSSSWTPCNNWRKSLLTSIVWLWCTFVHNQNVCYSILESDKNLIRTSKFKFWFRGLPFYFWNSKNSEYFLRRLVDKLDNMKKNAMGNGTTQCILCGDEFGLLGASPTFCDDCKSVSTHYLLKNNIEICHFSVSSVLKIFLFYQLSCF